jgi:Uma2 family endonuclease
MRASDVTLAAHAMTLRTILTYDDYAALPADGRRYELHEGEISVTPAPTTRHQQVVVNLLVLLHGHVTHRGSGRVLVSPVDCILADTTVVQPDIVYVDTSRLAAISERGIEGAPTLVVEVLSASTRAIDRGVKAQIYARHRVPHYWSVDPDLRTIDAYELDQANYRPAGRLERDQPSSLSPFHDLTLPPPAIWR